MKSKIKRQTIRAQRGYMLMNVLVGVVIGIGICLYVPGFLQFLKHEEPPATVQVVEAVPAVSTENAAPAEPVAQSAPVAPALQTAAQIPVDTPVSGELAGSEPILIPTTALPPGVIMKVYDQPVQTVVPGQVSDYAGTINVSSRAVDHPANLQLIDVHELTRNGLRGNPAVDPASSKGAAYSRAYAGPLL